MLVSGFAVATILGITSLNADTQSVSAEKSLTTQQGKAIDQNLGFTTVIWARTAWQATTGTNCDDTLGTRTLEQNAKDLQNRGLAGVGGIVVTRTYDYTSCFRNYMTTASWSQIADLRDDYGWKFISQGMEYKNMTLMKYDSQRRYESLDTLPILANRGHTSAWGAFNYANNKQDAAAQRIVTQGFAFGRKYGNGKNTKTVATKYPYIMNTNSINGGRCHNKDLDCYDMKVVNDRRSTGVDIMQKLLSPGKNEWSVIQFYRLVEGKRGKIGDGFAWDCTSSNWRNRWTSQPELTCRESFLEAFDGRTTRSNNVDPATVARLWGVIPKNRQ